MTAELNKTTNRTTVGIEMEMPLDIIMTGTLLYSVVFLVGIVGNLSVIYVFIREKGLRNFTNYLLANLSVADLLVLIACVPSGMHDLFAKERWYLGRIWCYMVTFIENCMGIASLLSMFFITVERFYVICRPLKVKSVMTQSSLIKLIIFIWITSISINIPFIYLTDYRLDRFFGKDTLEYKCVTSLGTWSFYYIIIVTYVLYFIIGLTLLAMYYKIAKYLRNSMNFMGPKSTNDRLENRNQKNLSLLKNVSSLEKFKLNNTNGGDNNEEFKQLRNGIALESTKLNINKDLDRYIKPRKQLIMMLMCVIISFYVCVFPLKIWTLILILIGHQPYFLRVIQLREYWYISIMVRFFFYANSAINPILYNYMSKKYRRAFKNIFIFRLCFRNHNGQTTSGVNDECTNFGVSDVKRSTTNTYSTNVTRT